MRAGSVAGSKVLGVAGGAVGGVLKYGALETARQEIETPGKTMRDLENGEINPDKNELAASALGGAAAAGAAAAGAAGGVALAAAAVVGGSALIVDQESRDPGKTVRDINGAARDAERELRKVGRTIDNVGRDIRHAFDSLFGRR
jgi:hypothetical protein